MKKLTDSEIVKACGEVCSDNRFELIEKYKKELFEHTNIHTQPDEVSVLDSLLFRFWQMDWLDKLEEYDKLKAEIERLTRERDFYKAPSSELAKGIAQIKNKAIIVLREKCIEHQDFHKGDDGVFRAYVSIEDLDNIINEM